MPLDLRRSLLALVDVTGGRQKWMQGNHRQETGSIMIRHYRWQWNEWGDGFRRLTSQKLVANRCGKSGRRSRMR